MLTFLSYVAAIGLGAFLALAVAYVAVVLFFLNRGGHG